MLGWILERVVPKPLARGRQPKGALTCEDQVTWADVLRERCSDKMSEMDGGGNTNNISVKPGAVLERANTPVD